MRPERLGAGIPYTVPRNTYRTSDGHWIAISTSSAAVASRMMRLVGLGDVAELESFEGRQDNRERIDEAVAGWISVRPRAVALEELEAAEVAAAPVHDMADIFADEHFAARSAIAEVDGVPMQQLIARLSATPGSIRWAGRPQNADSAEIRAELADPPRDP
ncbi:MAG: CoA transferase [Microthrixaceae bacterium]